jgi:RIO-like serine/threonine protein kinase
MNDRVKPRPAGGRVQGSIDLLSSPSVSKARTIEILTSPGIMIDLFRERLAGMFPQGLILKECKPQVLKSRQQSRQVVAYRLIFSHRSDCKATPMTLVAKRFADRKKGNHEYLIMRMLWEEGFDDKSNLRIPRPFAFFKDLNLLIQENAHGTLLGKSLSRRSPVVVAGMKAAARWLTKLHQVDLDDKKVRVGPADEVSIRDFVRRIGTREPKLLPRLEKLGFLISRKLSSYKRIRSTLVHGDFQSENIFVDKEKVTVIDFGRCCKSDPARDPGCMIAHARTVGFFQKASFVSVFPGLKAFWEEYLMGVPVEMRGALSERTCTFVAAQYLKDIDYISAFSPEEGSDAWHALLNDAEHFAEADRVEEVW